MRTGQWWHAVGTVAVGACLALGVGHGVAAAEEDGHSGSSESASASTDASTDASTAGSTGTKDVVVQHESPTPSKDPVKPTSTVSASTVTIHEDATAEPEPKPDPKPVDPGPVDPEPSLDATPSKSTKHTETPTAAVTRSAEPPTVVTPEREIVTRSAVDVPPRKPTSEPATEPAMAPATITPAVAVVADEAPLARPNALVAAVPTMAPPPQPNLINVIGTLLFTVLTLPLRLLEQTPVVLAGYAVTVGRSTLDIGCGCGQTVDARWYFPDAEAHGGVAPQSVVYLQHGFIRSNANMSAMAIEMAERTNSVVVTPTLTSNPFTADGCWINGEPMQRAVADLFVGDRTALTASAVAAGWTGGDLPTGFVLAGHSAGGGLAAAAAGYTVDGGAASNLLLVLLLDGVPTGDALPVALGKLTADGPQVLQIASPPYVWNSGGVGVEQHLQARPGEFVGVRLVGGSHVDYEGASSDLLAQLACGFPRQENVRAAQGLAVGWINDAIAGRRIVAPAGPGQTVTIPTAAGVASAVVLGGVQAASTSAGRVGPSRV